ncbi:DUF2628 domain-containing protein [Pseudomonas sp. L-22-4S-12]|nr:DUF2628 domain-containing protein [Pseudomonas sp. L-22-4S-12]
MKSFDVFHHPAHGLEAVKTGFSWPGLCFGLIWALYKQLWWLALGLLLLTPLLVLLVLQLPDGLAQSKPLLIAAVQLPLFCLIGFKGNQWQAANLQRRGFALLRRLQAASPENAVLAIAPSELPPTQPYHSVWYKQFWPWFILGILGMSITLGTTMLVIATKNPPGLIADNYYDVGKGINTSLERENLANRLKLKASLVVDNDKGTANLQLQGYSNPPQLVLNLISPTQPERDRRVILQLQGDGSYFGQMPDLVEGRRFVELIGQEGGQDWRLFEEEQLASGQSVQLGE